MRRTVLLLAGLALVAPAVPTHAAVPKFCGRVTDADDDQTPFPASMDIRRVEAAAGKKTVVGVLTLESTQPDAVFALAGMRWDLSFQVAGAKFAFSRRYDGLSGTYRNSFTGVASVVVKVTSTTITWTVPRSAVPALKKPKTSICMVGATTSIAGQTMDSA